METTTELQQMVDVSIGVESNILDLNVLNSLLHIIVRRLCPCFQNESTVDPDLKDLSQDQKDLKSKSAPKYKNSNIAQSIVEKILTEEIFDVTISTQNPLAKKPDYPDVVKRLEAIETTVNNITESISELTRGLQNVEENVASFFKDDQLSDLKNNLDELQRDLHDKGLISTKSKKHIIDDAIKSKNPANHSSRSSLNSLNLLKVPTVRQSKSSFHMQRSSVRNNLHEYGEELQLLKEEISEIKSNIGVIDEDTNMDNLKDKAEEQIIDSAIPRNIRPLTIDARMSAIENCFESIKIDLVNSQDVQQNANRSSQFEELSISIQNSNRSQERIFEKNSEEIAILSQQKNKVCSQIAEIFQNYKRLEADKVNMDDLEELLSSKADFSSIQNKVSIEHFNSITFDLNKTLDDFLRRMIATETMWEKSVQEIFKLMETKLDREDTILKSFVNQKLTKHQNHHQSLANLPDEKYAAGTKLRLLKNVNCISCGNPAIMKTFEPELHQHEKPHAKRFSPSSFLAHKQIDKARKIGSGVRMSCYEEAMRQCKVASSDTQSCLRFCGGSHTKVTGEERKKALQN